MSLYKGLSSHKAGRGHAINVDGEVLSVTINRMKENRTKTGWHKTTKHTEIQCVSK